MRDLTGGVARLVFRQACGPFTDEVDAYNKPGRLYRMLDEEGPLTVQAQADVRIWLWWEGEDILMTAAEVLWRLLRGQRPFVRGVEDWRAHVLTFTGDHVGEYPA